MIKRHNSLSTYSFSRLIIELSLFSRRLECRFAFAPRESPSLAILTLSVLHVFFTLSFSFRPPVSLSDKNSDKSQIAASRSSSQEIIFLLHIPVYFAASPLLVALFIKQSLVVVLYQDFFVSKKSFLFFLSYEDSLPSSISLII